MPAGTDVPAGRSEREARLLGQGPHQTVLERLVVDGAMRLQSPAVVPVPPAARASGSSLTVGHSCVWWPSSRSSGALGPPILVGTRPGSTALPDTPGCSRATAAAGVVTKSLLSAYDPALRLCQSTPPSDDGRPPRCELLLRYTRPPGRGRRGRTTMRAWDVAPPT